MSVKNSSFVFRLFTVSIVFTLLFGITGVAPVHAGGGPLYVKPAATGTGDCLSWANACALQTALAMAGPNNSVWVMAGIYRPTPGTDRSATFQLKSGAIVYGGFAGTETTLGQRDPLANVTILDGNIGVSGSSDNSYHVVTGTTDTTLDGFTITGGNANGASPDNRGGGMYNPAGSNPSLSNIIFLENSANYGGGLYNYSAFSRLMGVTFVRNSATVYGGGMYNYDSSPALTNVTFSDNTATESGGGMLNRENSNPTLTNVTFSGNSAGSGGGLSNLTTSSPIIRNTIFWDNTAPIEAQISNTNGSLPSVGDSVVQGGYEDGVNIIDANPMLGTLGDYGGFTLTIPLLPGSSAIDALTNGTNGCGTDISTDQRGVARPQRGKCDIGAFEYNYTGTYYTKPAASGLEDCQSWENACPLRNALSTSVSGDSLWAMAGTHKPTTGFSRTATFQLKSGVAVYGGFAGTETSLNQRDPVVNITTLSGNINLFNDSDSYHVVTGASGATLDGFTIKGGNANGDAPHDSGGGLYNDESSPTLANLIFTDNLATDEGGGLYNNEGSPTLTHVTFSSNSANYGGGMYNRLGNPILTNVAFNSNTAGSFGGGVYNIESSPILTSITFSANSAGWGGGMQNTLFSNPTLTNVTFSSNTAYYGGGMRNSNSTPALLNVTFTSNQASDAGGGMYNLMGSNPTLTNVTFSQNSAETGGGMYNSTSAPILANVTFNLNEASSSTGGMLNEDSSPTIRNTILWGNYSPDSLQIKDLGSSAPIVSDSVIQGGYAGGANIITADPLLGTLGNYGGYTQTIPLQVGSSAIDTGNAAVCPASDQRGVARPQGAGCDIGAYEYEVAFTKSAPANGATGHTLSPTLSWQTSSGAVSYEYCYSSVPGPCTQWHSVGANTSVTLSGLSPNYTYYWQVRAVDAGGTTEANGGTWWSFTTTAAPACTWPAYTSPAAPTFGDVPMDVGHWSWVERLANSTITAGCGAGNYCPFNEVNRAQMAIFLLRGKHCGSSYTPPAVGDNTGFADVPLDATYAPWVKQLAAEGITAGCGGGNFCPQQVVNRAQMAIFLLRARHGSTYSPPAVGATTGFNDVPLDATYAAWVKQLAAEGVTAGCGGGNFCPLQNVNRAQMATFLVRAFGLP